MSTINTLSFAEMYKLTNWLKEAHSSFSNLTQDQIANAACSVMGFRVTTPNLINAAKTLGILIGAKNARSQIAKTNEAIMAQAICNLYLKLGELIPADLKSLAE